MKSPISAALLITIMSVLLPISGQSEEIPARGGPIQFSDIDKNGNSLISEQEFNTLREERMARRAAEGKPMRGATSAPMFADFDTNKDGEISEKEFGAFQSERHRTRKREQ